MPPKAKLNKISGKQRNPLPQSHGINNPSTSNNVISGDNGPELTPEARQQFEVELCWCIQQLQYALKQGKLNPKQVQDHTKALNALMSNSTSLIKKRQVMRLSFGDYRVKMAEENKKHNSGAAKIKILTKKPSNKSMFIKKSLFNTSNGDFKFNFNVKTEDDGPLNNVEAKEDASAIKSVETDGDASSIKNENNLLDNISNIRLDETTNCDRFHFITSDNTFKFNFQIKN